MSPTEYLNYKKGVIYMVDKVNELLNSDLTGKDMFQLEYRGIKNIWEYLFAMTYKGVFI